ncbi:RING finger protein 223-like [Spea bombifrons]|uniref:RING finger protein 223-like n=1 Tax=Spea bombifrons TaxID=233779 RepID=UPI00234AA6DC|nr:RING finger protein 223-like [Spea bombifrons]
MEQEYNVPECPICFVTYDNVFKTPLLLPCSHTFCMECLAKLCIFQKELDTFCCPICRGAVTIPPGGVPKLPPNMAVVAQLPPWMGSLQEVWMEGSKLCWKRRNGEGCVTTTQNTVSHFPSGAEDNVIIVYLLGTGPAPPNLSSPGNLVIMPRQPYYRRCCATIRSYFWFIWIAVFCIILLFFIIMFPISLRS